MVRGVNRQNIFEDQHDREQFITILSEVKAASGFRLLGYCLMDNHVHLLVCVDDEPLATAFKRIGVRYVPWFNKKYGRCGPLFQGRYKSEAVEDQRYLLSALRYILQNPVKAGICATPGSYRWSSYADYLGEGHGITDTEDILSLFSPMPLPQRNEFRAFMNSDGEEHLDIVNATDAFYKERLERICGVSTASRFQALPTEQRDLNLGKLKASGLSIRRIVRLTGIPFGVVRRAGG
jgi:REP element-mobilizing transposase RayT